MASNMLLTSTACTPVHPPPRLLHPHFLHFEAAEVVLSRGRTLIPDFDI